MDWVLLVSLPLISALVGWLTNRLAVQMLFHPRRPWRLGRWSYQGLIPRRQRDIAAKAGEIVARDLLNSHVLKAEVERIDIQPYLDTYADRLVKERLAPRLQNIPLLGRLVNESVVEYLHGVLREEMGREAPALLRQFASEAERHLEVQRLVEERVQALDLENLEAMIKRLAGREFRQIEILGGVLGLLVGLAQMGVMLLSGRLTF